MEVLTPLAWVFYGVIAVGALFFPSMVTVNDVPVRNPLIRVALVPVVLSFVGVFFYLFGLIGQFLLLPIRSLF